jgi:LytR cell envelope-related transcriptional attenuator
MEQSMSMPPPDALVRPWRTATLVVTTIAAFELVLILVLGVALLGKPLSERMRDTAQQRSLGIRTEAKAKPKIASSKPTLSRAETTVIVLNGNGVSGAAHEAASRVGAAGYSVGEVGNANRTDFTRSVVMYRPGYRGEAMRLARDMRIRIVGPLDGMKARELMGAHVALVVGA